MSSVVVKDGNCVVKIDGRRIEAKGNTVKVIGHDVYIDDKLMSGSDPCKDDCFNVVVSATNSGKVSNIRVGSDGIEKNSPFYKYVFLSFPLIILIASYLIYFIRCYFGK
jgi:hypothetical protein